MKPILPDGLISRAVREGLELREKLLADGMDIAEADRIVGEGLRAAWIQSTQRFTAGERIWHYYCQRCRDSGWIGVDPDVPRLQRLYGTDAAMIPDHRKCDPCPWQHKERESRQRQQRQADV